MERELLAVIYECETFHTYLSGCPFTVKSDHKHLESIHFKHLKAAPPPTRVQRILLRLQPYNLTIKYTANKDMLFADVLLRLSPEDKSLGTNCKVQINEVCPSFNNVTEGIRDITNWDTGLPVLKDVVQGWS